MNITNKEKLIVNIEAREEEHNIAHESSTITMKSREWCWILSAREK
jgi:hypothetical protein